MAAHEPIDPRVRLAIAQWPDEGPARGTGREPGRGGGPREAGPADHQGRYERFHPTLFCYLDKQPLADSLAEPQAQIDAFDHLDTTDRPHQGLPGRVTPSTAWEAAEKAVAPRPKPEQPFFVQSARKR